MADEDDTRYCLCRARADDLLFMIACDACGDWFHGRCVGVLSWESEDIDTFICPPCTRTTGRRTAYKDAASAKRRNVTRQRHRLVTYTEGGDEDETPETIIDFAARLAPKRFSPAKEVVTFLDNGEQLRIEDLYRTGFRAPIIIREKSGLGLEIPENITLQDVVEIIGPEYPINVISVGTQSTLPQQVALKDWYYYMNTPPKEREGIFNVISLEFSNTRLASRIKPPTVAHQLDMLASCWPSMRAAQRPRIQRYCLTGVKDAYTDFHVDFGGTSVWYHIVRGRKIFYLIEPTSENFRHFKEWSLSPNQHKLFLGDMVEKCYRLEIKEGQTLLLPSGWIHAVFTPEDSLVFGGNYISELFLNMQLRIASIEEELKVKDCFRYPLFEDVYWYTAERLCTQGSLNPERVRHVRGWRSLLRALRRWADARTIMFPPGVNPDAVVRRVEALMTRLNIRVEPHELAAASVAPSAGPSLKLSFKREAKVEVDGLRMKVHTPVQLARLSTLPTPPSRPVLAAAAASPAARPTPTAPIAAANGSAKRPKSEANDPPFLASGNAAKLPKKAAAEPKVRKPKPGMFKKRLFKRLGLK